MKNWPSQCSTTFFWTSWSFFRYMISFDLFWSRSILRVEKHMAFSPGTKPPVTYWELAAEHKDLQQIIRMKLSSPLVKMAAEVTGVSEGKTISWCHGKWCDELKRKHLTYSTWICLRWFGLFSHWINHHLRMFLFFSRCLKQIQEYLEIFGRSLGDFWVSMSSLVLKSQSI